MKRSNLLSADTVKIIQYYFCVVIPALTKNMFDFFLLVDCMRTTIFIFLYGLQIEWSWGARDISGHSKVNLELNLLTWSPIFCYMFDPSSSLLLSRWRHKQGDEYTHMDWIYLNLCTDCFLNTFRFCHRKELPSASSWYWPAVWGHFHEVVLLAQHKVTCSLVKILSYFISQKPYHANLLYCS